MRYRIKAVNTGGIVGWMGIRNDDGFRHLVEHDAAATFENLEQAWTIIADLSDGFASIGIKLVIEDEGELPPPPYSA
jgi:hypothetical protein